jgi:hypothetical protein
MTTLLTPERQLGADAKSIMVLNTTLLGALMTTDRDATCATGSRDPISATTPTITMIATTIAAMTFSIESSAIPRRQNLHEQRTRGEPGINGVRLH